MTAQPAAPSRRLWIPYLVLVLSLLVSAAAARYAEVAAAKQDQLRFQSLVQKNQALIRNRMETYVALLHGAKGLFTSSDDVSAEEFRTFVNGLGLQSRYPGIQGMGFSLRVVDPDWRQAVTEAVRRTGDPRFRIWPDSPRQDVHTIVFLEPLDRRNRAALGYDMSTEPVRRAAMERARDTGRPAATSRVVLVQEIEERKQAGFLIYLPVYHRDITPATSEERRATLTGFVYAAFRADDLLQGIRGRHNPSLALEVYAGEPAVGNLLHRSHSPRVVGPDPQLTAADRFEVAGQPWTVVYSTLPAFEAASGRDQGSLVLFAGLLISLLLFGVTYGQVEARARAERIAADLRRSEREVREEAGINEALHSIGLAMAAELDLEKLLQTLIDEATRVTGASYGAFFYNRVDADHESYMLYTLSGVPREAFAGFPMPRSTPLFAPTFRGEDILRIHDVLADPRYGHTEPYHGMPPGHVPVRSYLAAPVASRSGEVLGGMFFGHPEPGVFTARAERVLGGIAAQASVAIENARLYEAERGARAEAETANRAKDRFVATLSHELRTPLTPVLAVLSRLETLSAEEPLPAWVVDGLAMVRRNVELEARLIDDLLDLTRISQGKLELRRGPTDLRRVLEHALEASARPDAPGPRVELELEDADLRLQADAPRLTQVFWNLLSNARKFTPAEGLLRIRVWRDGEHLAAEVSDTGVGIEPELLPRVFDAFQQGEPGTARQFGGLGLGLAISRRLVEMHGGGITAESEGRNRGATFTVRLPAGRPGTVPAKPHPASQAPAPPPPRKEPLRILLVEDHPDTAEAMAELLRATGREVKVARSLAEGLSAARAAPASIDLVISDIGLPDGSGIELMTELSRTYGLPGIALTGYGMEDDVARSREAGFSCHLTKPVTLEQLEAAIRQVAPAQAPSPGEGALVH